MSVKKIRTWLLNKSLVADIISRYIVQKKILPYYTKIKGESTINDIVYIADGLIIHGGLSDRLRGMVSLYAYCFEYGIPYHIYHISPFNLSDYLVPNEYNWKLDNNKISFDSKKTKVCVIRPIGDNTEKYFCNRLSSHYRNSQLLVYTNVTYKKHSFSEYFNRLFTPSLPVQNLVNEVISNIGENYVSLTFRFQQLLGDFNEAKYKVMDEQSRKNLINKCLLAIERVYNENDVDRVLVTSDSKLFLEIAQKRFKYVAIIPGEVKHIDYTNDKNNLAYIKSFVDLFVISKARKVYFYSTGEMYEKSGFAETGAMIGGREYVSICE